MSFKHGGEQRTSFLFSRQQAQRNDTCGLQGALSQRMWLNTDSKLEGDERRQRIETRVQVPAQPFPGFVGTRGRLGLQVSR